MGLLRRCVDNPVATNMIMVVILFGGLIAALKIPREMFPEFELDRIGISVAYPGASPSDIERSICQKIEEQLKGVEGIKEITSTSREGIATVLAELHVGADARKAMDEIKSEVDKIDFPEDAEDPVVVELTLRRQVINIAIAGDAPERTLKEIAEEVRDELVDLPEISQVTVSGVRDYEITVEVSEEMLRRHKLTIERVSQAIRQSSFDLPAGTVKTPGGEMTIRVVGERLRAHEYESIPVLYRPDGTVLRLGDMATVREGFADVAVSGRFNGKPAAMVNVYKTANEDTIEIARAVHEYLETKLPNVPEGIVMETLSDRSKLVRDRLSLLVRNGVWGLVLVFLILWTFLRLRLSIWVAMGIPVAILGTILVLFIAGSTLNMMSMFALIMALGLIVDDAIIVGENVFSRVERGESPRVAAVEGTRAVLLPVLGAVLTTWLAFIPLMFIPGIMGRFMRILPFTVILTLAFSLLECLVILPPHLGHWLRERKPPPPQSPGQPRTTRRGLRDRIDGTIQAFIHGPFSRVCQLAIRGRYITLAIVVALCMSIGGAVKGGRIKFNVFPSMDSDTIRVSLVLPTGTPKERTAEVAARIALAADRLNTQVHSVTGEPVVQRVLTLLGQQSGPDPVGGSHVADVIVELLPSERRGREVTAMKLQKIWRENTGEVPDALSLKFGSLHGGPRARALELRLLGPSTGQIKVLAEQLKSKLATFNGVRDIEDDALPGKMEMQIRSKPGAENIGAILKSTATQLRNAFYGSESLKIQRGRDEIKVMVRYPESLRKSLGSVEGMRLRTAEVAGIPFAEVTEVKMQRGYTTLRRVGGKSVVTVSADVDEKIANAEQILGDLRSQGYLTDLAAQVPGTRIDVRGQRQQWIESLDTLKVWFPISLLGIYAVLAAIFKSYIQPLIIMVAIPFGLVGAVIGHLIVGFDLTLLSMFGMVALTGIVVNDSLVLIDLVNRKIRTGQGVSSAVIESAVQRFRPILLTTVTTVGGMAPLLLERSFQAQFLKPMVVSIAFGLSFATVLTLLVVPSMYLIGNDVKRGLKRAIDWLW